MLLCRPIVQAGVRLPAHPVRCSVRQASTGSPSGRKVIGPRAVIRPGHVGHARPVPASVKLPPYASGTPLPASHPPAEQHSADAMVKVKRSCEVARDVLELAGWACKPGVTTDDLDRIVHEATVARGAYPSPRLYHGFPLSVCTSVNEVVVHGIPDSRPLEQGDVISVDVSCFMDGYHGDTCRTFRVGDDPRSSSAAEEAAERAVAEGADPLAADRLERVRALDATTHAALWKAIHLVKPGLTVCSIGNAIQAEVDAAGFASVPHFFGHGLGTFFHTLPLVGHVRNRNRFRLRENMTFTIEPMIVEGDTDLVMWPDKWTAATADSGLSAQYEHTLAVTADGVEVLTAWEGGEAVPGALVLAEQLGVEVPAHVRADA